MQQAKVVCLHTGDKYPFEYVEKLYRGLCRHTSNDFVFEVVTKTRYPGWWGKIEQFAPMERIVLLDIDIVITGNVDFLFEYDGPFCAWKDPWQDGLNGSVHSIAPGFGQNMKTTFMENAAAFMRQYKTDQDFLRDYTVPDYWPHGLIQSYKAQGLQESPKDARIVVFHGYPKPDDINDGWVKELWQ